MSKMRTALLAVIAGSDVVFTIFTPIILAVLWMSVAGAAHWSTYTLFGVGLLATIFRAIKIGWMR